VQSQLHASFCTENKPILTPGLRFLLDLDEFLIRPEVPSN
jgi:hypothetical protein